jgi:hypothetical protein
MGRISLKLKNTANFIKSSLKELVSLITKDFDKKRSQAENKIRKITYDAVYNSPEMNALRSGQLAFDLGIEEGNDPTPLIATAVASSVNVRKPNFRILGNSAKGDYKVEIQPNSFSNLLTQSFGTVVTEKGQQLPWLSWLLVEGDSIIVAEWSVEYGPYGRSGGARMVPGGAFTIDPQYSGTISDNFVSRALEGVNEKILKALVE